MSNYIKSGQLQVAEELYSFVNNEVIPGSGVTVEQFWGNFESIIEDLTPINRQLLAKRDELQNKISAWHKENPGNINQDEYEAFLKSIGYLVEEVEDFEITTNNVDPEIAIQAGPQLVVPVDNARYAINAANARWGSLYDALYGTDVISEEDGAHREGGYNPVRGTKVIEYAKNFLNQAAALQNASHSDATQYAIEDGKLVVTLSNGNTTSLVDGEKLIGYQGEASAPSAVLIKNNDLHFEIQIDRQSPIGKSDAAGVKDILVEAAITAIMDFEDSIAAVDAEDKTHVYRNWLGLMKGDLTATFAKGDKTVARKLNPDREYTSINGETVRLNGRALLFVRNVGHLMTNSAILDAQGNEIFEGIMDGVISNLIAKHTLLETTELSNTSTGSIYVVKPKMHGPEEVAFANTLFNRVEDAIGLARNTIKIGVMDEERRTSVNLKACVREVRERIAFINTGFLDRTGDEIHTSMEAGPMIRKGEMKSATWLLSYEKSNVLVGLGAGFQGRAQVGKGMWAMPDLMAEMMKQKIGHLQAGANTAWVPSNTAATLHAMHYHQANVKGIQNEIAKQGTNPTQLLSNILTIPLAQNPEWTKEQIQEELDNNAQGILGYVVRWVEQGVGCSKVPDLFDIALMEDRATLRISSQMLANWLHHNIISKEQVEEALQRMAVLVDKQNEGDSNYHNMSPNYEESVAFQAARDLVFLGVEQASGYTEPTLHRRRIEAKAKFAVKL